MKFSVVAVILSMFIIGGCDNLDDDQLPDREITDFDSESFLAAGSMAIIDISGGIEAGQTVNLNIAKPPSLGRLESFEKGLLKYLPNSSFSEGQDFFNVEIKSEKNELLAVKTVKITVNPDSTDLPCTLIAFADSAYTTIGDSVLIDVLKNDWDCDAVPIDSTSLTLTSQPANGEATVVGGKVRYVPNVSFSGADEFVYSVSSIDKEVVSHALVQVVVGDTTVQCSVQLVNDWVYLPHGVDSLFIPALENDSLCDLSIQSVSVSQQPQYGEAFAVQNDSAGWHFEYILTQANATGTDQFTYRVCDGNECYEATVFIDLNTCSLRANPDYFVLQSDSLGQGQAYELAVLNNDIFCTTDSLQMYLISGPSNGSALVDNLKLIYATDSVGHYPDSLVYKVCQGTMVCDSASVFINFQ
ncbi:Ig-like domain-containing protein [Fulvivirgaceae bacterium BMA12]|uniref:Ig-like domain-containing protein n=1 Tax=Agaribacillus aureus TaxID=3051825 RepID=A0ABT8L196_9BACT|nr:Ig-like domain-containing protein [Fulvivirgaceae bacterium BMA12]